MIDDSNSLPDVRVGVDIVDVAEVSQAVERFGSAYLDRVYTDRERADCTGTGEVMMRSLAGRFAAKEAVIKLLGVSDLSPAWRDIEVVRTGSGAPAVHLHGDARALAERNGLRSVSVSITHDNSTAAAFAACIVDNQGATAP